MRRRETTDVLFKYMGAQKTKYRAVMLYTRCTAPSQDKKSTAWISIGTVMCRTKRTWGDLAAVRLEIDAWVRPLSRNPTSPVDLSILHRKLLRREAARGAILTNVVTSLHTMDGQCVFFFSCLRESYSVTAVSLSFKLFLENVKYLVQARVRSVSWGGKPPNPSESRGSCGQELTNSSCRPT